LFRIQLDGSQIESLYVRHAEKDYPMNSHTRSAINALEALRIPELQAKYLEVLGTATRCPNRTFLVRKISEALAANDAEPPSAPVSDVIVEAAPSTKPPRGRFRGMTVEELQQKYVEVVGRPSGSENKAYLVWKIREAEKGHVPVGPIGGRRAQTAPIDTKVLPLRIEAQVLRQVDEAWRRRGIKSRMEFLRLAIAHYLEHLGA